MVFWVPGFLSFPGVSASAGEELIDHRAVADAGRMRAGTDAGWEGAGWEGAGETPGLASSFAIRRQERALGLVAFRGAVVGF